MLLGTYARRYSYYFVHHPYVHKLYTLVKKNIQKYHILNSTKKINLIFFYNLICYKLTLNISHRCLYYFVKLIKSKAKFGPSPYVCMADEWSI